MYYTDKNLVKNNVISCQYIKTKPANVCLKSNDYKFNLT